jgi:hypothetical protein
LAIYFRNGDATAYVDLGSAVETREDFPFSITFHKGQNELQVWLA